MDDEKLMETQGVESLVVMEEGALEETEGEEEAVVEVEVTVSISSITIRCVIVRLG